MTNLLHKIVFWDYKRASLPYDVFCLLILAFVFLTPRAWFERSEPRRFTSHRTAANTILISASNLMPVDDGKLQAQVREAIGKPSARIKDWRPVRDVQGAIVAYEVDIE